MCERACALTRDHRMWCECPFLGLQVVCRVSTAHAINGNEIMDAKGAQMSQKVTNKKSINYLIKKALSGLFRGHLMQTLNYICLIIPPTPSFLVAGIERNSYDRTSTWYTALY